VARGADSPYVQMIRSAYAGGGGRFGGEELPEEAAGNPDPAGGHAEGEAGGEVDRLQLLGEGVGQLAATMTQVVVIRTIVADHHAGSWRFDQRRALRVWRLFYTSSVEELAHAAR
jgi:hypothetical protein